MASLAPHFSAIGVHLSPAVPPNRFVAFHSYSPSIRETGSKGLEGSMTSIAERLITDLGEAMKTKDNTRRDVVRYLRSEIRNAEIEKGEQLTDAEVLTVIQRQVNQRREAAEQFERGGRQDLVDAENAQISILQAYLPAQISEHELDRIAADKAAQLGLSGSKDMGKLMGPLRDEVGARAEGKAVADAARKALEERERGTGD
jgi:uncharacterized protein